MYIRKKTRIKDGKRHDYWALVESYRTESGSPATLKPVGKRCPPRNRAEKAEADGQKNKQGVERPERVDAAQQYESETGQDAPYQKQAARTPPIGRKTDNGRSKPPLDTP